MRHFKWHQELLSGIGKCGVPVWEMGCPAGFCDRPAYGERTEEGRSRFDGYSMGNACFGHGGPERPNSIILEVDGNQWCAYFQDFTNLQESPCGFGDKQDGAILDLLENMTREGVES